MPQPGIEPGPRITSRGLPIPLTRLNLSATKAPDSIERQGIHTIRQSRSCLCYCILRIKLTSQFILALHVHSYQHFWPYALKVGITELIFVNLLRKRWPHFSSIFFKLYFRTCITDKNFLPSIYSKCYRVALKISQ